MMILSYTWKVMYVVLVMNSRTVEMTSFKASFAVVVKDHRLKDSLIYERTVFSVLNCAQLCLTEYQQCRSINVEREEKSNTPKKRICQLNNDTSSSKIQNFAIDSNFNYFEMKKIQRSMPSVAASTYGKSCADLYMKGQRKNGVYTINPDGQGPFQVRCDMTTAGGGWTLFQRRLDGSVDFFCNWADYQTGFGNLSGEFWLGLDHIHRLSASDQGLLRIDLVEFENGTRYAQYNGFAVANRTSKYKLTVAGYTGTAGNSLTYHNNNMFSTKDKDNDQNQAKSCAVAFKGAWWYKHCHSCNLNGLYLGGSTTSYAVGVVWNGWRGHYYSLKNTEMKVRPINFK